MGRKLFWAVCLVLAACVALSACGQEIHIRTPGDSYEFVRAELAGQLNGADAPAGEAFLLVELRSGKSDMDDMANAFFSYEKAGAQVSDGTSSAACQSALYAKGGGNVAVTLVFRVPSSFAESFTLSGEAFEPVALAHK